MSLPAVKPTSQRFHPGAEGSRQVFSDPALIPSQQLLRLNTEDNPFYITFDEANITATQPPLGLHTRHTSTSEGHATALTGNVAEESWLIHEAACDKTVALGLTDLPTSMWMLSLYVPNAEYWQCMAFGWAASRSLLLPFTQGADFIQLRV